MKREENILTLHYPVLMLKVQPQTLFRSEPCFKEAPYYKTLRTHTKSPPSS